MAEQILLFDIFDIVDTNSKERTVHKPENESIYPLLKEWSHTRRNVLEQCPRWYYYQYYGANLRTAKSEPQKEALRFLKTLSNRYQRIGKIAHHVIRTYLTKLQRGEAWTLEQVLSWARYLYRQDLEYSRQYRRGLDRGDPLRVNNKSPVLLMEFYYGFEEAEAMWVESEAQLLMALTNFVTSPQLAHFRAGGYKAEALIEKKIYLREEHFSLKGQLDLAYPENGRIVIVDWKIGRLEKLMGADKLQLSSYALGAMQEFKCALDNIDLCQVHLSDIRVSAFTLSEKETLRAKVRIIQDLEKMRFLDSYGRRAIAEAFTPCGQPNICALCPFQKLCPKE